MVIADNIVTGEASSIFDDGRLFVRLQAAQRDQCLNHKLNATPADQPEIEEALTA